MGRHGGINILHQKSWHVWRLDNRLTVERDELRHAEAEREKKKLEEGAVFSAKIKKLRLRAEGREVEEALKTPTTDLAVHGASSSSSSPTDAEVKQKKNSKLDMSFKYGKVTMSNLKKAETHLDSILSSGDGKAKGSGKGKAKGQSRYGKGDEQTSSALGSGTHFNFFEAAEQEQKKHMEEHQKQIGYTQRNNELAGKSTKALFSEFDEIASHIPWYMRTQQNRSLETEGEQVKAVGEIVPVSCSGQLQLKERSRSRSGLRSEWKERHGQNIVQVTHRSRHSKPKNTLDESCTDSQHDLKTLSPSSSPCRSTKDDSGAKKLKKRKKEKKKEKTTRREERREQERQELFQLRKMREEREVKERARVSGLMGATLERP